MIGAKLRGELSQPQSVTVGTHVADHVAGGTFGAVMFNHFTFNALYVPAAICGPLCWHCRTGGIGRGIVVKKFLKRGGIFQDETFN